jgi:hypothetical protein
LTFAVVKLTKLELRMVSCAAEKPDWLGLEGKSRLGNDITSAIT